MWCRGLAARQLWLCMPVDPTKCCKQGVCCDCHCPAGAEDGSINVWNFHSGRLLSSVDRGPAERSGSQWGSGSGVEVTGLAMATSTDTNGQAAPCIVATGWDRKVRSVFSKYQLGLALLCGTGPKQSCGMCSSQPEFVLLGRRCHLTARQGWACLIGTSARQSGRSCPAPHVLQVTWYADTGKRQCQLLRSFPGADSDVLAAAAMKGCCTLATACDGGEVSRQLMYGAVRCVNALCMCETE